ncbi:MULTISPECIES: hypothetical protein [Ralstonia solanacearum species complex]|uniref:hypothetical protein n=1 Tax=Ralstonia solanacearum species complex TaxID=3116862 RepID=UPI000E56C4F1|nr:hypothetical protein [Ralstonia solanacearum]BEU71901.1 hypothetical protein MAFF211271_14560 [Ralstonia pseudosolanacearum]AXV76818.1 hypothetical protein CJO76_07410 [Ralstonia solanacearum]AXV90832.1 hypothetical protein CJO79_07395 [Ralstonia solanacearum]AXW18987.1 hypothetical protein CJO85_07440 [Ralstonia solanacearum]AXW61900.1 hypothetical protein CJO94_07980 [Ralstonia solanacearum]
MDEIATAVVIELAKEFIELMRELDPKWSKAYYRFRSEGGRYGSNASYISESNVSLIGALKWAGFYERMNARGAKLVEILGKTQGVFLLTIDAEFSYDIKFDWEDLSRWEITKLDGGTGLPQGI